MSLLSRSSPAVRRLTAVAAVAALTALSFAGLPQSPAIAGDGIVAGGVFVPDNAAVREVNSFAVNQVVNGLIDQLVNEAEFDALGYNTATIYVVPVGSLATVPWWPKSGTIVRERSSFAVWLIDGGPYRYWIENPTVLAGLGYTTADIRVVANGSLTGFQVGDSIGTGDLPGEVIDPLSAHAATYHSQGTDDIGVTSADGKAASAGDVTWYKGGFPFGYRHRGGLTRSPVVTALRPVGCIWAQVKWGYVISSVTFPPSATIAGAEEVGKFFMNCRTGGNTYPAVINLRGLSYSKALLKSVTLTVCTSASKADGPRNCGSQKRLFNW
jgi:hypothetical protein